MITFSSEDRRSKRLVSIFNLKRFARRRGRQALIEKARGGNFRWEGHESCAWIEPRCYTAPPLRK